MIELNPATLTAAMPVRANIGAATLVPHKYGISYRARNIAAAILL